MEKKKILTYFVALATVVYLGAPLTYAQTEATCNPDTLKPVRYGQHSTAVKNLQACLIQAGYDIPAGATGLYGPQTVNAVKKFYAEWYGAWKGYSIGPKGIEKLKTLVAKGGEEKEEKEVGAPTTPSTQNLQAILKALGLTDQQIAAIMAIVSGTTTAPTTTTQPTTGVEGTMVVEKDPSVPEGQTLREGETQDILALRITAQSSDITVKSFRLVWPIASRWEDKNSVAPTRAITQFQVVDDQGNVLQTIPASSFSQEASTLDYYYYVTGLNYVVPKGTYKTLKVKGTAVGTFPSGLANGRIVLAVAQNDVRGVDQAGVDRFGPSSGPIINYVTPQASISQSARFVVSRSADTPLERYIFADTVTQRIDKEPLLYFTLQAKNDRLKLLQLTASATGSHITTLYLYEGKGTSGKLLGSVSASSTSIFTNLPEVYVDKDEVKDFTIAADFANVDTTPTTATIAVLSVQSQNSLGDTTSTDVTGVVSNPVYSLTVGPQLSLAGSPTLTYTPPSQAASSSATAVFNINVTPKGGTVYISTSTNLDSGSFRVVRESSSGATATTGISVVINVYQGGTDVTNTLTQTNGYWTLSENQTYTFKVTVVYDPRQGGTGVMRFKINSIAWGSGSTANINNLANFVTNSYYTDWVNIQ